MLYEQLWIDGYSVATVELKRANYVWKQNLLKLDIASNKRD